MENKETQPGFVRMTLPWLIAAGAFLLYLITVNRWVSVVSLPIVSKVAGWDWTMPVQWPLFFLVTFPFKILPASIQPIALNIFSALCGAAAVGLLARAVALLPHDRTHEQRLRERSEFSFLSIPFAWLPPLFAALIFGLQLTMWEHATAATGESLDILLFAYIVRGLLEYRVDRKESWMIKLALVYGLGITNSWAFIGFFPLFLASLIWIKGKSFFNPGLLAKMFLFGLLGLSLYLLLPLVWVVKSPDPNISFWDVLKTNWIGQKNVLFNTPSLRNRAFLLSLTSLLPVLIVAIRWPSSFGDTSAAGAGLTNIIFRVVHIVFWGACLAMAFDMKISPRGLGLGLPFLSFYFLGALAVGYFSGYLLLVFTELKTKHWMRSAAIMKMINPAVRALVWIGFIAAPIILLIKNFPVVHSNNGAMLKEYTQILSEELPKEQAYLLSEDPLQISLMQAYLKREGKADQYVLINTRSLEMPSYHEQLVKHYGNRWPTLSEDARETRVDPLTILATMMGLAQSNSVYYLHPSFGYYFEKLYAVPHGSLFKLELYKNDEIFPPELPESEVSQVTEFWKKRESTFQQLVAGKNGESADAKFLSVFYSRGMNNWGVQLQKQKQWKEAGQFFDSSFQLNTNNVPAKVNLAFNQAVQGGKSHALVDERKIMESFGKYRTWDALLSDNGPFDQPQYNFILGQELLRQSLTRQAAHLFHRTVTLNPTNFLARQYLAQSYLFGNWISNALAEIEKAKTDFPDIPVTNKIELITLESACYNAQNNYEKAEAILLDARKTYPREPTLLDSMLELYRAQGKQTNALAVLEEKIKLRPNYNFSYLQKAEILLGMRNFDGAEKAINKVLDEDPRNVAAQLYKTYLFMQKKDFAAARREVDKALKLDSENVQGMIYLSNILMESNEFDKSLDLLDKILDKNPGNLLAVQNKAIIAMRGNKLEVARDAFETLQEQMPRSHAPHYYLGEIAYRLKNYDDAVEHYESYLKYAPKEGDAELAQEKQQVIAKLEESKAKSK
ncbi:MAG: tetratricopeptide repeat protein [Verrucomicrobiales bacterium]